MRTNNGKSNKQNKKGSRANSKRNFSTTSSAPDLKSTTNDPSWYASDPSLLRDAASIPFSRAVGTPVPFDFNSAAFYNSGAKIQYVVPGVMALGITPTYGSIEDKNSPINVAATATYSFIRYANSGHSNYDSVDLMLYLCAMSQIYSYINFLQRIYGLATLYSQRNRYMPRVLLEATEADPDDVVNNLANFRYGINVLINQAASLSVPANMPIFARQAFLYQNVYSEGQTVKDQMYMFVPDGFLFYHTTADPDGAGSLELDDFPRKKHSVQELLAYGQRMLQPILQSEDMNIMSGDILKAYGANALIKLTSVPEDYSVAPVYDLAVLEQIKNATVIPGYRLDYSGIRQSADKDFLTAQVTITSGADTWYSNSNVTDAQKIVQWETVAGYASNRILTTSAAEPTPEIVMENTRLMVSARPIVDNSTAATKKKLTLKLITGSEVVTSLGIYSLKTDGSTQVYSYSYLQNEDLDEFSLTTTSHPMFDEEMAARAVFKYAPAVIGYYVFGSAKSHIQFGAFFFDVDNYAVITYHDLEKLHEAALLNEFHVPSINKIN